MSLRIKLTRMDDEWASEECLEIWEVPSTAPVEDVVDLLWALNERLWSEYEDEEGDE